MCKFRLTVDLPVNSNNYAVEVNLLTTCAYPAGFEVLELVCVAVVVENLAGP